MTICSLHLTSLNQLITSAKEVMLSCLVVSNMVQKLLDGLSRNLMEQCVMGQGRADYILV